MSAPNCQRRSRALAECSACVLRLLLGLTLKSEEAVTLLAEIGGPPHATDFRDAAVLDRLIASVRLDARAAERLGTVISAKLALECRRYEWCSVCQLAELWGTQRHALRGRTLAALLWTIGRGNHEAFRKLELHLTQEIELLAIRSLADQPVPTVPAAIRDGAPNGQTGV